jgi:ML domain
MVSLWESIRTSSHSVHFILYNAHGRDKNGVTIEPTQPMVGANITVTVKGRIVKRVTSGSINVDLRLMKYIKLNPTFDLCEQLEGDLFRESNTSCPLEEGPVTLIAKTLIPEDVPKVSVAGNITLTNQDDEILTCIPHLKKCRP